MSYPISYEHSQVSSVPISSNNKLYDYSIENIPTGLGNFYNSSIGFIETDDKINKKLLLLKK